jgi:3-deoxy-D-manno-octulosonic-acid transferase
LILVSARISPKSVVNYRRLLPLFRETLSHGILIAAQSDADANRFLSLGANPERTWVTGNNKFDIELPPGLEAEGVQLRTQAWPNRRVWIAGSTHDQEELQVLEAHQQVLETFPDALLILVPRHPERFPVIAGLRGRRGIDCDMRTSGNACPPEATVFLGNTMGELPLLYAASDVAFVGGTLVAVGGHNLLEPAALGLPVITGPYLFNTGDIASMFSDIGASITVADAAELAATVKTLFEDSDKARAMGAKGKEIVASNRGSLQKLLVLLDPLVNNVRSS